MESNLKISTELVKVSCYTKSNALGLSKCFKAYREDDNCNYIMDVSFPGKEVCMVIYNTDINTTFTLCSFMGRDVQYIINYGNSSEVCFDHYEDLKNHFSITI